MIGGAAGAPALGWRDCARYGALGLPLAFVALPLYVILPNHYAREFGVPLALLGWLLLGARLFDAVIDPLLGRWVDRLFIRSHRAVLAYGALAAGLLGLGFAALFFPLPGVRAAAGAEGKDLLLPWAAGALLLTYTAFSALSISHQSWGARLGGDELQRSRIVAWREALGLVGVILASIVPVALGLPATLAIFWIALIAAWLAWTRAPHPTHPGLPPKSASQPSAQPTPASGTRNKTETETTQHHSTRPVTAAGAPELIAAAARLRTPVSLWHPFSRPAFRSLLLVFMLNGIASAVPATLVLFFVQDRLQAPESLQPAFLGSYFLCAALSIPLWLLGVRRFGLARCWLLGMGLAVAVFIWALQLEAGDNHAFLLVCALSGVALGTDLALPGALLAGVIQRAGDSGHAEGSYFGWWNFATKLNLALAAGLALPLLELFGYSPGVRDPLALQALGFAYCLLPCALKLAAAALLYLLILRKPV